MGLDGIVIKLNSFCAILLHPCPIIALAVTQGPIGPVYGYVRAKRDCLCIGIDGGAKSILEKTMVAFLLELFRLFGYSWRHPPVNLSKIPNLYNPRFSVDHTIISAIAIIYRDIYKEKEPNLFTSKEKGVTFLKGNC